MGLLQLVGLCLSIVPVTSVSNGNLPICSVDMSIGNGTNVMKWVQPPVNSAQYTLSVGGGGTTWSPGVLTPITLTVNDINFIYIGILMVAEGIIDVNGTKANVGSWTILEGDPFHLPPSCKFNAITHSNADLKPISATWFWKGTAGLGTISFRALIKQGEQNHGNFYRPANLVLTELAATGTQTVWRGAPGASCDDTCAQNGQACDQAGTLALNNAAALRAAVQKYYPCRTYVRACDVPGTGSMGHCYFNNCSGYAPFDATTTCSRRSGDPIRNRNFCACTAGGAKPDPQPPAYAGSQDLGWQMTAPLQLGTEITINSLVIQKGNVTFDITGPQDRWFAIGWNAAYMAGTYATAIWLNDPTVGRPQNYDAIGDHGYPDGVAGFYDVRCQQALIDFCRNVGGGPTPIFFSCAVANSTNQYSGSGVYLANKTSRVPCKAGKVAPYKPMTVGEYRLRDNPRGANEQPSIITPLSSVTEDGRFRIRFSRPVNDSLNPWPVGLLQIPVIWSIGWSQIFNSSFKHEKKADSPSTVVLVPIYPVCAVNSANSLSSSTSLFLFGLFGLFSVSQRKRDALGWVLGFMLLASVQPASAHNWMNTPSRALWAAVSVPCQQRVDPGPHVQVGPGQSFQMEWSTGHGDTPTYYTYFVLLKEEDYNMLIDLEDADMEDYLSNAPPGSIYTGDMWTRRHLAPYHAAFPGCLNCNNYINNSAIFQSILAPSDPRFVVRDPVAIAKSNMLYDANVTQFWYPAAQTDQDKRAEYKSSKYPWMLSVHKFRVPDHWPSEYDLANFKFPTASGPGNYIAHFKWGGYRDCTDVNLQSTTVPLPYGAMPNKNLTGSYVRLDHCEFTHVLNPSTPCRRFSTGNASQCLADCMKQSIQGCNGVQAVRYQNPAGILPAIPNYPIKLYTRVDAAFAVFPPLTMGPCDSREIAPRNACPDVNPACDASALAGQGTSPDDYVCYGLSPYRDQDFQTTEDYVISNDPLDQRFYSSCWIRLAPGGFLPYPPPAKPVPHWQTGSKCLSCSWIKNVFQPLPDNMTPKWEQGLTTDCENCDTALATTCEPTALYIPGGNAAGCTAETPAGGTCTAACDVGFQLFGGPRTCKNGLLMGAEQSCAFSSCP